MKAKTSSGDKQKEVQSSSCGDLNEVQHGQHFIVVPNQKEYSLAVHIQRAQQCNTKMEIKK